MSLIRQHSSLLRLGLAKASSAASVAAAAAIPLPTPVTVTGNVTLSSSLHHIVLVDASGGSVTISMPDPAVDMGPFIVKKIAGSALQVVTITPFGSEQVELAASLVLALYQAVHVASDGSDWWQIN